MEIVAAFAGVTISTVIALAVWAYVRIEQHKIKYGNPEEIKKLREDMAEYSRIINMLDQEALKVLEKRVTELAGQMRDAQVTRVMR